MPAPLLVPFTLHFDFRALPFVRVMESFAFGEDVYAGVQDGTWLYDEWYWSERKGAWGGQNMPARQTVSELSIEGGTLKTQLFVECGEQPLIRLASGTALKSSGTILYGEEGDVPTVFRLYSCATGALVAETGASGELGTAPEGSYLLWSRFIGGPVVKTPCGDCRRYEGEWSAVRVVVGTAPWTLAPNVCPSPGYALYHKNSSAPEVVLSVENAVTYGVAFDPLARSVSSSCQLAHPLVRHDGSVLVEAGSQLIGGLRASRSGPQTALWILNGDGTSRLLGVQEDFSNGFCECGKTNHNAVDVVQSPSGELFVLSECSLFRFVPDAPTLETALVGFPAGTLPEPGHPGGNCLRFPKGENEMVHWTEAFGGVNDRTPHYNRMVRRVAGRDVSGPSTLWHGTNCADIYMGRFWGIRADDANTLYLDWLDNGRWHGYNGMSRAIAGTFWQRLRAVGNALFVFGFAPGAPVGSETTAHNDGSPLTDDKGKIKDGVEEARDGAHSLADRPICALADGLMLRDAVFPFFIRRATVSNETNLFVAARGDTEGVGPANRVVEIDTANGGRTRICSFWDEDDKAFVMDREQFEELGGNPNKIPPFFVWYPQDNTNAGGKWKPSDTSPTIGFWLTTVISETLIHFFAHPGGTIPYDVSQWNRLCFDILADGSTNGPFIEPTCTDARCAYDSMPEGTRFRVIERPVHDTTNSLSAIQITDASDEKRLSAARNLAPTLWMRIDSNAPRDDLTSYTHLTHYGRLLPLPRQAKHRAEIVVLVSPNQQPLRAHELPLVSRRA